jgi:hypothetical protein
MAHCAVTVCATVIEGKRVVEVDVMPIGRVVVTRAACHWEVIARRLVAIRTLGIAEKAVIDLDIFPVGRVVVAGRARIREVIGRRPVADVAAQVAKSAVVDNGRFPRRGGMTVRTLPREVVGGFVFSVATEAICQTGVVHGGRQPGSREEMAQGALPFEVIGGFVLGVASQALLHPPMVK